MIHMQRSGKQYVETAGQASDSEDSYRSDSDGEEDLPPPPPLRQIRMVLDESKPGQGGRNGLKIAAEVIAGPGGKIGLSLMVMNCSPQPLGQWAIQFQKNPFGLAPAEQLQ